MTTATTAAAAATAPAAPSPRPRLSADLDTFLKLLTTQLRNQDPSRAMDTQQMTQQLVQFAAVEQQLSANANLERLIALQQAGQLVSAAPLMGRLVEVESDRLALQEGGAALRLPPAGEARAARIEVLDERGRVVRAAEARLGPQATEWRWDGLDQSGRRRPDGAYALRLTGLDARGQPTAAAPEATVLARATGVERRGGEVRLLLGAGLGLPFERLRGLAGEAGAR